VANQIAAPVELDVPSDGESPRYIRVSRLRTFARRHILGLAVLVVICSITVVTFVAMRGVVRTQEQRLLNERAKELAAFLTSATTQTLSTLTAAGEAVSVDGPNTRLFTALTAPLVKTGATVAVAQPSGTNFVAVAVTGTFATVGQPVSAVQERLIQRAKSANGMVFNIAAVGDANHFIEAIKVPGPTLTVVMLENVLPKPRPIPSTKDSPYRELNVALYAGTKQDPSRLVLISGAVPSSSAKPAHVLVPIGVDSLLLVAAGHSSLVGGFAQAVPWIVLAGGFVLAILLCLLVEILARRREYAVNLVEQRTRALYKAQQAAEAANRSKSEFLSRMSHELRTPLNAVLGFSQLLELDELTPDQDQAVAQITKGGRHLLDLINEILDITQIEAGKLALSPEAVNVRELIHDAIDLVRPLAEERGVHLLRSELDACNVFIFADRQRVKQIMLNLLGNAIKYNREGGTVSISCTCESPGRLQLKVTDTGPGIPREQFGLLFTPFERLGADQTTVEGTGIGLALSRRLAEVMGGTLEVDSTVGRGSTFWVELPIVESPIDRIERLDELGATSVIDHVDGDHRPAVLHIEDNLSNIKLIERVLAQRPGVHLIPAMQGRLGLELARQHRPALILLDLNLADISGEEVLSTMREDPLTANVPVAIVSADAMPRQAQRLLSAGATAYLTKPIDVRQLLDLVDTSLEAYARRIGLDAAAADAVD